MRKRVIYILLLCLCCNVFAQQLKLKVPKVAYLDEGFRVEYSIESKEQLYYFEQPQISGAEIISGPYTSKSSSNINGRESYSASYVLILKPTQIGKVTLSAAKIKAGNKTCYSQSASIEVRDRANNSNYTNNHSTATYSTPPTSTITNANTRIDKNTIFVRAVPSKTSLVKGEALFVTYKLYILSSSGIQTEDFKTDNIFTLPGFEMEELNLKDKSPFINEVYNGKTYKVATLKEILLYPHRVGGLTIPELNVELLLRVPTNMDRYFSTGDSFIDNFLQSSMSFSRYEYAKTNLSSNAITINVESLPIPQPDNFIEGVGSFILSAVVSANEVRALDAFYLIYTIEGRGNLTQITSLPVELSDKFQVSSPEIMDNINKSSDGLKGSRTFRYLVIPMDTGSYVIPKLSFAYYDNESKQYRYLESDSFDIHVTKSNVSTEYAKQLEQRAKFKNMSIVPTKNFAKQKNASHIFDRPIIYLILFFLLLITIIGVCVYSSYKKNLLSGKMGKSKRVADISVRRLKKAKTLLDNGEYDEFEKEILATLWTYLLDKFSKFDIDNLPEQLNKKGVSEATSKKMMEIFNACQYMRYTQNKQYDDYNKIYENTMKTIVAMEEEIKQNGQENIENKQFDDSVISMGKRGLKIFVFFVLIFVTNIVFADNNDQSRQLNQQELCLKAENYFKEKDYANSILYYEKALKLSPNNENIRLNINIVRSRLTGDCYIMPEFALVRVSKYIAGSLSLFAWAVLVIVFFIVVCVSFCFYRFSKRKVLFFYICIIGLILFLFPMYFGITLQQIQNNNDNAIIMETNIKLKTFRQDNSKDILTLYKGQKIKIIEADKSWLKVQTEDRREGYINNKGYKRI